jgi:hypothetical protein
MNKETHDQDPAIGWRIEYVGKSSFFRNNYWSKSGFTRAMNLLNPAAIKSWHNFQGQGATINIFELAAGPNGAIWKLVQSL